MVAADAAAAAASGAEDRLGALSGSRLAAWGAIASTSTQGAAEDATLLPLRLRGVKTEGTCTEEAPLLALSLLRAAA